ncbi:MAG: SigB/SigF/SigG family RNA polymerase sigma factor [Clostridiales bacterium]|nr:SigB/SigF/SigG family RNA polymerase sigma factor [Clostridiales bacterium]
MLTQEETIDLIRRSKNGDNNAKEELIKANSPLIKCLIKRYLNKGIEYDDLFQLGSLGFIKAIYNFDESFQTKFSTYVVPMIVGEIKRFMRDDGAIKVSRALKSQNIKIKQFSDEFVKKEFRKPTYEEIAKHFDMEIADVVFTIDSSKLPISIYTPIDDEENKTTFLLDKYTQDQSDDLVDNIVLKEELHNLCERDKQIIVLRFFRDKTQSEIAKILGVSQVQVSRLENKILEKMRKSLIASDN